MRFLVWVGVFCASLSQSAQSKPSCSETAFELEEAIARIASELDGFADLYEKNPGISVISESHPDLSYKDVSAMNDFLNLSLDLVSKAREMLSISHEICATIPRD
jgi:hypothetical protein